MYVIFFNISCFEYPNLVAFHIWWEWWDLVVPTSIYWTSSRSIALFGVFCHVIKHPLSPNPIEVLICLPCPNSLSFKPSRVSTVCSAQCSMLCAQHFRRPNCQDATAGSDHLGATWTAAWETKRKGSLPTEGCLSQAGVSLACWTYLTGSEESTMGLTCRVFNGLHKADILKIWPNTKTAGMFSELRFVGFARSGSYSAAQMSSAISNGS